ncbi:unnamed protein product, partial [Mesorhabditis belari]|uniref:ZP domain-containing protein n=1 Tax=Mesorhabditis belari TaxID=2138241 RepID=A0AAF3FKC5_9BILA
MRLLLRSLILFLLSPILKAFSYLDNQIIGNPRIHCNSEDIELEFESLRQFTGKVYVKGSYNKPECRVDYSKRSKDGKPTGGIRLNHGACNMDRQRMITPDGMMFSTVLVISFHPLFVTKVDRAYHIKCMYKEMSHTVTASLDVSPLPTEPLYMDMPMPTCTYTIRKDTIDGQILRYARVGDQVVHRWECDSEQYGVLVHSCYVEDGQGEKQLIIDEHGCHTDRILLGDPTYVEALNMAYRESFVFKFADRVAVRFQCEIRLCLKEEQGCDGVTPPICFDMNHRHVSEFENEITNNTLIRKRRKAGGFVKDADLISQTLYVLEADDSNDNNNTEIAVPEALHSGQGICIGIGAFTVLATSLTIILLLLTSLAVYMLIMRVSRTKAQAIYQS